MEVEGAVWRALPGDSNPLRGADGGQGEAVGHPGDSDPHRGGNEERRMTTGCLPGDKYPHRGV